MNFDQETRRGSKQDVKNAESLFKSLGFRVYKYKNLTKDDFDRVILQFSSDKTHGDIMVLIVMSHGGEGGARGQIFTSDEKSADIEIDIIRYFMLDINQIFKNVFSDL